MKFAENKSDENTLETSKLADKPTENKLEEKNVVTEIKTTINKKTETN